MSVGRLGHVPVAMGMGMGVLDPVFMDHKAAALQNAVVVADDLAPESRGQTRRANARLDPLLERRKGVEERRRRDRGERASDGDESSHGGGPVRAHAQQAHRAELSHLVDVVADPGGGLETAEPRASHEVLVH